MDFGKIKKVYCIGIGGIGLSALAQFLKDQGIKVSGSDRGESPVTENLEKRGIEVVYNQDGSQVPEDADLIIYTKAMQDEDPEMKRAKEFGIEMLSYPEALGRALEGKFVIAVSGTHGKTTTTAMISEILIEADLKPTIIAGSLLKKIGSNYKKGEGEIVVVEACEYKRSFLNLNPSLLVITNIEEDHLDYYKDLNDIMSAFKELANKVDENGTIVCDLCNITTGKVVEDIPRSVEDYSLMNLAPSFNAPGHFNAQNGKAAKAVANILSVPEEIIDIALSKFEGTWRRFENKGETPTGSKVLDDYAHHPTEIQATLRALRETFPEKKLRLVFQSHLYSRTKQLLDHFAKSFGDVDTVLHLPIYAAREPLDETISHEMLAKKSQEIDGDQTEHLTFSDFKSAEKFIIENYGPDDVIMTMGAGDVFEIADNLVEKK